MRETKFKAWHKTEKVMCDVSVINFDQGAFLIGVKPGEDEIGDKYFIPAPTDGRFCDWDEIELLQYTGLKDKNGKDIYEGDIIRQIAEYSDPFDDENDIDRTYIGEVVSIPSRGCCLKRPSFTDNLRDEKGYADYYLSVTQYRSGIIGNIHENPELLK